MTHFALPTSMFFKQIDALLIKMMAILFLIVTASELDVMLLFFMLDVEDHLSPLALAFADAAVLSCVASLPMYFWIIKPVKKAIDASRYRHNILSSAVQNAGDGIMISNRNGDVEYINQAFRDILKCDDEDVVGKPVSEIDSIMASMAWKRRFIRAIRCDGVWYDEYWGKRKNGEKYLAKVTVTSIVTGEAQKVSSFVTIMRDQTSHHDLQVQCHQAQKMEAVGTLVGGIAHDFNNMLSSLTGHIYLAKVQLEKNFSPHLSARDRLYERLLKMESLTVHTTEMIKHLMLFARKGNVEKKPFSLSEFMRNALKLVEVTLPSNIDFQCAVHDEGLVVCANATQLQQAIMNLINNAKDALDGVAQAEIKVGLKKVDAVDYAALPKLNASDHGYVEIYVTDNGCGIDAEILTKIMEPFFTTKAEGKGTGLGLAMVYGIVKEHQGHIEIKSRPGEGTSFHMFFPLSQDSFCMAPQEGVIHQGCGELILLVDDQKDVREGCREVLLSLGYRVLEAEDGVEGLALFFDNKEAISAVLSDVVMPRMQGVEMAFCIKQESPDLPVILVSGYDKNDMLDENAHSFIDLMMNKPLSVSVMSDGLQRLLNNSKVC